MLTKHDFKRILPPVLRSSILGTFVGVLPGSGATTGSMVGYAMQKKFKSEEPSSAGSGHSRFRHRRRSAGRPDDVGPQPRSSAV